MSEESQALNNEENSPSSDETLNPGTSSMPMETDDGLLSTAEFIEVENKDQDPEEGSDYLETGDDEKGPVPYDRFQEKVKFGQEQTEKLTVSEEKLTAAEKRIAELEGQLEKGPKQEPKSGGDHEEKLNFRPMHVMNDDDLTDWFDKKPLEFISNLAAQIMYEARRDILGELETRNRQTSYREKLSEFGKKHDDFDQFLDSGRIEDFVRSNPGHDVFSAYYEMTTDKRQQSEKERTDKAVAEALEKQKKEFEKNLKAKRELRTISGSGGQMPHDSDVELKDTSVHGGLTATLAARLAARRKKAG